MKVNAEHPEYASLKVKREDFAAVKGGTDSVRARGVKCLPKYPGENADDYAKRLNAATIDGIVSAGVDTLCGKVFDKEIDTSGVRLDPAWLENFDNEGAHFNNFARKAFEHSFDGFSLILADMPMETEAAKELKNTFGAEADRMLNIRPYCRIYTAANVINWHYRTNPTTQVKELVMLVLREVSEIPKDRFEREKQTRYRVYELNNGAVTWELWLEKKNEATGKVEFIPDGNGTVSNVRQIPCATVGDFCDEPKLLGESRLELRAYRKESSFDIIEYLSIPVFYTVGYPENAPDLVLSSSTHLKLPADPTASVGFAQIDSAGHESLKGTIAQIKDTIKGRLNQLADTNRVADITATETNAQESDKRARLTVWADELKDALERSLQFMGQLAGKGEDAAGEIVLQTAWLRAEILAEEMKKQTAAIPPNNQAQGANP